MGDARMIRYNPRCVVVAFAIALIAGCSGSISEPWVSGAQADDLELERTRSAEEKQMLGRRLARYADAYQ